MLDSPDLRLLVLGANGPTTKPAGKFCAYDELATMLLDQPADPAYVRPIAAVGTPGLTVEVATMLRGEVLER